ncbi:MAG: esterase [Bacteroidetes bacterium]|nr:MAG: esterase [Bacteroidota bacterium]
MILNTANKPSLEYLYREPKVTVEQPPLLILLHGVGSNEKDLFSLAPHLPDSFLIVSARGPITLGANSYAWYQVDFSTGKPVYDPAQEKASRAKILSFIDELKPHHKFDSSRVYFAGFSQGAIMSYSLGLTHPEKIKAIGVMSGRLLEEVKPEIAKEKAKSLKVFISHGTRDGVLPIHYANQAQTYLKELGITPVFKQYNEGHGINAAMLQDLVAWLKEVNAGVK